MGSWSDSSDGKAKSSAVARRPSSNYRVRFRHGVYPNAEGEATRADIKKYDYFFGGGQTWVGVPGNGMLLPLINKYGRLVVEMVDIKRVGATVLTLM